MKKVIFLMAMLLSASLFGQTNNLTLTDEKLDQSQTSSSGTFYAGDNWQSFTVGKSGVLAIVRAYHYNTAESGVLSVYEGEGTNGKLLHEQPYTATGTHFLYFPLSKGIPVQAGKQYTFRLSNFRWFVSKTNVYTVGKTGKNAGLDLLFETFVRLTTTTPIYEPLGYITDEMLANPTVLGEQPTSTTLPAHRPGPSEENWTYDDNIKRMEINSNGLGRCYDIRNIDLLDWTKETLEKNQASYVVEFYRNDQRHPARWDGKNYVKPKGVEFTATPNDIGNLENKFVTTASEFSNEVMQEYRGSIGVPNIGALKASATFTNASSSSDASSNLTVVTKMYKNLYKLDLQFDDPEHQHYINSRFWNAVKRLGHNLSAEEFTKQFGTHYASSANYGGNFMQIRTVNHNEYAYNSSNEQEFKVDIEGTLKQVEFGIGTTQRRESSQGRSKSVRMESAKIYTVGGNLNFYKPESWASTVKHQPTVVNGYLSKISDLLTKENFPEIPNISQKKQLLEKAIVEIEKGVGNFRIPAESNNFWSKKDAVFELTINTIKCMQQDEQKSQYSGNVSLYFFGKNNNLLMAPYIPIFQASFLALGTGDSKVINKKYNIKVPAAEIENGFAALPGKFVEYEVLWLNDLPDYSPLDEQCRIPYAKALFMDYEGYVRWADEYDALHIEYKLRKLDDSEINGNSPKRIQGNIKIEGIDQVSASQSSLTATNKIKFSLTKTSSIDWWKAVKIYDKEGNLLQSLELENTKNGSINSQEFDLSKFNGNIRIELWKQKTFGVKLPVKILYLDRIDCKGKNTLFHWFKD